MTVMVEILSQETIKPSSPTPHHLRTLNLSLLDQYAPIDVVKLILFYDANANNKVTPDRLKKSLSETLTQFYPLAGTINGNDFILCNDEGVTFFEARVNAHLYEIVSDPLQEDLFQLLPRVNFHGQGPNVLLSIQLNVFDCGGTAIAVIISHKAVDASSLVLFLNTWASLARGEKEILSPKFELASLFPPKEVSSAVLMIPKQKVVTKRFVFNSSDIASLKAKCSNKLCVQHPTKVEAISALIWKCAMKSSSMALITVNLRGRLVPPLSNLHVGNPLIPTAAASVSETEPELHVLAGALHDSIAKIGADYVKNLQFDSAIEEHMKSVQDKIGQAGDMELFVIASWCRLPFYEADFGSGKPVWVCPVNHIQNILVLMDTKCGKGVEAWVGFNEEVMAGFETYLDLSDCFSATKVISETKPYANLWN